MSPGAGPSLKRHAARLVEDEAPVVFLRGGQPRPLTQAGKS
jgi:hypothetical protein